MAGLIKMAVACILSAYVPVVDSLHINAARRALPRAAPRAAPAAMVWVDHQASQGLTWDETEGDVDVTQAASRACLQRGPSKELEPGTIVELVLEAFQRGSNQDIEDLWNFVDPDGELAQAQMSSAGAMSSFKFKVRKEPRWKNIAARPHAALLHMRSFEIAGGLMTDPDIRLYMVRAQPFFPDAPQAESDVLYQFKLARRRGNVMDGCWLISDIAPDYGSWSVRDPIGAGQCPDVFVRPKRSAEH